MRGHKSRLGFGLNAEVCFAANITIASSGTVRPLPGHLHLPTSGSKRRN
jgi:hypothetical protein